MATVIHSSNHFFVSDFGAKPNSREDASVAVMRAIQAASGQASTIEFASGEYHFYRDHGVDRELYLSNTQVANPRKIAILLENRKDLVLKGNGARLIFHDRIIPFAILNSKRISLEGFTVDWERPLMSQGLVVASGTDGFTLSIDKSRYPYVVEDGHLEFTDTTWKHRVWAFMEFDPTTRGVQYRTGDSDITDGDWKNATVNEPTPGFVHFEYRCTRFPNVGDVLVARHGVRDHAGTFIQDSKDIKLSHIAYRHTSGLGVLSQYSENIVFKNVEVAPDASSGRLFAGHDDGFHFSNCKGKITVEDCKFEGLMDDPINVHGTAVRVIEKLGARTLKCRFMHNESVSLRFGDPGDAISFIDHNTMLARAQGKLATITHLTSTDFQVDFRDAVPIDLNVGDALENLTWTPSFTVRNSDFGRVRARGLLVSTPRRVVIENCLFRSSGAAILIAGDANYWYESGAVSDVTIRSNRFENCNTSSYQDGDAIISIHPEIPKPGPSPFHSGIRIEDNTFIAFDAPILWAKSVHGLSFRGNTVVVSRAFEPFHANRFGLTFIDCEVVQVEGNRLETGYLGTQVKVEGGKPNSIRVKDWTANP